MEGLVLKVNTRQSNTGDPIRTVKYFTDFKMSLKYDSVASTFAFGFYFDPSNVEHAEIACVSHMHECQIFYDEELLITGFTLSQTLVHSSVPELVQIGGYSKPGVLEDCDIPTKMYPLESNGKTFRQIVQRLISPFNFEFKITDLAKKDANTRFTITEKADKEIPKSTAPESQNIKSYLTELATQKNLILTHDEFGNLLITEANTKAKPLFVFDGAVGMEGITKLTLSYGGQALHSHITVIRQADQDGGNAAEYTIRNPFVPVAATYRPKVTTLTSGDDVTIEEAARNELAKELKAIVLKVEMDRGKIDGKFIRPNNTIIVKDREIFLYKKVTWFIESVDFEIDPKGEKCSLTCVPVYVYDNKTPENFFVDPHKNLPRV